MKGKMNSYDKTWHTWAAAKGEKVPMGTPMLAWSFNRDGEGGAGPRSEARQDARHHHRRCAAIPPGHGVARQTAGGCRQPQGQVRPANHGHSRGDGQIAAERRPQLSPAGDTRRVRRPPAGI